MSRIATFFKDRQPGRGPGEERNMAVYEGDGIHIIHCVLVWKTLQTLCKVHCINTLGTCLKDVTVIV